MRMVVITILILAVFFASSLYAGYYVKTSAQEIDNKIKQLEANVEKEDWQKAKDNIDKLMEKWEGTKKSWLTFLEHSEIDNIDIVLARLEKFVEIEENTEASGEIAELKFLIKHIVEKEAFRMVNIL